MKKLAKVSPLRRTAEQLARDTKGATMVEYALMLFLILVVAALAVKTLGAKVSSSVSSATGSFAQ
jgi:Flp pilus assembly pilin Flp